MRYAGIPNPGVVSSNLAGDASHDSQAERRNCAAIRSRDPNWESFISGRRNTLRFCQR
jgi:hypothetical protein